MLDMAVWMNEERRDKANYLDADCFDDGQGYTRYPSVVVMDDTPALKQPITALASDCKNALRHWQCH